MSEFRRGEMIIGRYKEIIFGFGLGLGMWLIDAAMHVQIGAQATTWTESFLTELLYPGPAQLFFRMLFLSLAMFFGLILWRSNQRQRQAQALEETVRKLYRGMTAPIMLIMAYSQNLLNDPLLMADSSTRTMLKGIYESAVKLRQLTEEGPAAEEAGAMVVSGPEQLYAGKPRNVLRVWR